MPATYTYKTLGQTSPTSTTAVEAYVVGSGKNTVVSTIVVCNRTTSLASYRIAVPVGGVAAEGNLTNAHYIVYDAPILANDTITLTLGISLAATDEIWVRSNTANSLSFSIFGAEIS